MPEKGEGSGSKSKKSKKTSIAEIIMDQNELADIKAQEKEELRVKQKEETEAALLLGEVRGVQKEDRQD